MKKDIKYLNNLEQELSDISKKDRDFIVSKYRNIIDEEKKNNQNKKIVVILKELGSYKEVAEKEKKALNIKENKLKKFVSFITKDLTDTKNNSNVKKDKKKLNKSINRKQNTNIDNKVTSYIKNDNKVKNTILKKVKKDKDNKTDIIEDVKEVVEGIKKEENVEDKITSNDKKEKKINKILLKKNKNNKEIKQEEKIEKVNEDIIEDVKEVVEDIKKEENVEDKNTSNDKKENKIKKNNKEIKKEEKIEASTEDIIEDAKEVVEDIKNEETTEDKTISNDKKENKIKKLLLKKNKNNKEIKQEEKIEKVNEDIIEDAKEVVEDIKKEETTEDKTTSNDKKENSEKKNLLIKLKEKREKKKSKNKIEEVVEEVEEETENEIVEVNEIVTEKHIFETKEQRRKRIVLKTLGIVLITILIFLWLWVTVIFIASLVAYLDGVRIIGINLALFGLDILFFWIIIMINKLIFKHKQHLWINLTIILSSVALIALGIVLTINKIYKLDRIKDVSQKYSMVTKFDTYILPSDVTQKMYITFNSNYDTQYMIDYDNTLQDKVKVEVKYYECYYDYYIKKNNNNIYVSLKLDDRDRLSVYIDDIKENAIYDNDELSRYTVRIIMNEKDYDRFVILD